MRFLISSSFTDSLTALDPQNQLLVKQSAFDFQLSPQNPGFQFHRITKSKEKNFWSFRVNRDIRIVVYKDEATFILCYADHHDAAYAWAERRRLDVHPETGAAQLVELQERVEEVVQRIYKQVEQEEPLFERFETDYLLALGVPPEWLDAVKYVGEGGFFDLIEVLPEEAAEHLMQLAQGQPVPRPVPLRDRDPFMHPDAQRRFKVVDHDEGLLKQALDAPLEKWVTFLHPSQRSMVEKSLSGPVRVTGGAGTGKTVVALHRAAHLTQNNPKARVLLTTYSTTLAARLKHNLMLLGQGIPEVEHIHVENLHRLAKSLWESLTGKTFRLVLDDGLSDIIGAAVASTGVTDFSPDAVKAEWLSVIDEQGLSTWEAYRGASRAGRGTPLGVRQRLSLWGVFAAVQGELERRQLMTFNGLCYDLARCLEAADDRPFDHVVADEVQDFGAAELKLLRALVTPSPNDLFLCGDAGQRIYKASTSFLANDIDIRGRAVVLRLNYRTTEQIRRYADALLPGTISSGDGELEERQTVSLLNGAFPQQHAYATQDEEVAGVAEYLRTTLESGFSPGDVAIFMRTKTLLVKRATKVAEQLGVGYHLLASDEPLAAQRLALGTMHRAKGLEFRVVVVMGCDAASLPLGHVLKSLQAEGSRQEFLEKEKRLFYVACTRAREQLMLTGVKPVSSFLQAES